MLKKTLGGDRLGAGKKQEVEMHAYSRSTHDRSYLFRTTGSMGTLIPFMKQIMTPGSTMDIHLACEIMTHPTVGPLFGSAKVQLDVLTAPVRLYQGMLHNNKLNIGRNMAAVKLPLMTLSVWGTTNDITLTEDLENSQINPSSLLSYLGIRGVGIYVADDELGSRDFQALWLLMYWDVYKNYYANKQEEEGAYIFSAPNAISENVTGLTVNGGSLPQSVTGPVEVIIAFTGAPPNGGNIIFRTSSATEISLDAGTYELDDTDVTSPKTYIWKWYLTGDVTLTSWRYRRADEIPETRIHVQRFQLESIDEMRERILQDTGNPAAFSVNAAALAMLDVDNPYRNILTWVGTDEHGSPYLNSQQGLALKTYQSDLLNNWLNTEWIDGSGGVSEISRVDTSAGYFTMDALALAEKVWEMMNRITTAGGSYKDWLDAVYTDNYYGGIESPVYHGSLIKELVFQEVVSNSESAGSDGGVQPLGTLAGRGKLTQKNKGGNMVIKVNEHTLVMGIFSLTPRIDYTQGNDWDTYALLTMDDFHKPALDQIGFQELIQEQAAWWSTTKTGTSPWTQISIGKQPSWTNYMTEINKVKGNFAIANNEMFMVMARKYEVAGLGIADMTTYIDPEKFNHIFAQTALDAQNYWIQIAVDIEYRGMMSAKQMPSL